MSSKNLKYYLALLVPVTAVFFLIPFELFFNGREYWDSDYSIPVNFAICGISAFTILAITLTIFSRLNHRMRDYLSAFLFWLGLFVLLADIFSPLQITPLDGTELKAKESLKHSLIELAIFLTLTASFFKMGVRKVIAISVPVSTGLSLIAIAYLGLILASSGPDALQKNNHKTDKNIRGNVYHFLLDEMQTDAAQIYFNELEARGKEHPFSGFTIFRNNVSNYPFTAASLPSYFSGTVYRGEQLSFRKWSKQYRSSGLLKDLSDNGYQVVYYADNSKWCTDHVSECTDLSDIFERFTNIEGAYYKDFIQIWFARIMPNFLTPKAIAIGKKVGDHVVNRFIEQPSHDIPLTVSEGKNQYASVLMLNHLITSEEKRPANGQYIYSHSFLPHGGFVINDKCRYDYGLRKTGAPGYYGQVSCSLSLVAEFIQELKRLDRFDNSTIIIHGDTGHGGRGFISSENSGITGSADAKGKKKEKFLNEKYNSKGWSKEQLIARGMSLLMIKPPHSSEELKVSDRRTQLVDLYPTLLEILNIPPSETSKKHGYSIFDSKLPENRQPEFFLYSPGKAYIAKLRFSDPDRLNRSDLSVDSYIDGSPDKYQGEKYLASKILHIDMPSKFNRNNHYTAVIRIKNTGNMPWNSTDSSKNIKVGARLFKDNKRTDIPAIREFRAATPIYVKPNQIFDVEIKLDFSGIPTGKYTFIVDIVKELEFWFQETGSEPVNLNIELI